MPFVNFFYGKNCRFTIELPFKKGNYCDRHFNRKKRFEVWVLLLYNFLSTTYNLISGTNPHEEDYRLTVDWHSCGFFYSKTKRRFDYVRETDN